ncbi:MAG: hypothetical protein U9N80_08285 [Chloroflexota bacterium]|nr:hypothetical protein [Chloroflexota bacterium]
MLSSIVGIMVSVFFMFFVGLDLLGSFMCLFPPALVLSFPVMFSLIAPALGIYQERRLQESPDSLGGDVESLKSDILKWLEIGEELKAFTIGIVRGEDHPIVIALTNRRLYFSSLYETRYVELYDIKNIVWNRRTSIVGVEFRSTEQRYKLCVSGAKWRVLAENLTCIFADNHLPQNHYELDGGPLSFPILEKIWARLARWLW